MNDTKELPAQADQDCLDHNNPKKSWRDILPVHPACAAFPDMPNAEKVELGKDINNRGFEHPIIVLRKPDKTFELLDGKNRLDALEAVGVSFKFNYRLKRAPLSAELEIVDAPNVDDIGCSIQCIDYSPAVRVEDYSSFTDADDLIRARAKSLNVHRRQLTVDQKRDAVAKLIKANPTKSNRQIAEEAKVSHPHVAKVRSELEKSGDVETVSTSIDTKGRKQPAKKAKDKKAKAQIAKMIERQVEGLAAIASRASPSPEVAAIEEARLAVAVAHLDLNTGESRVGRFTYRGHGRRADAYRAGGKRTRRG
jgi:hypothetical protein